MYTRGVGTGVCVGLLAVWCSCRLLGVLKRAYMGYSVEIVVSPTSLLKTATGCCAGPA